MTFLWLVIGSLAVWRVTHLLAIEAGPWNALARFRDRMGGNFVGSLFSCLYCLSLWTSAPVAYVLGQGWKQRVMLWLSLSGAAILLERATSREGEVPPASYSEITEEEEESVLRQKY